MDVRSQITQIRQQYKEKSSESTSQEKARYSLHWPKEEHFEGTKNEKRYIDELTQLPIVEVAQHITVLISEIISQGPPSNEVNLKPGLMDFDGKAKRDIYEGIQNLNKFKAHLIPLISDNKNLKQIEVYVKDNLAKIISVIKNLLGSSYLSTISAELSGVLSELRLALHALVFKISFIHHGDAIKTILEDTKDEKVEIPDVLKDITSYLQTPELKLIISFKKYHPTEILPLILYTLKKIDNRLDSTSQRDEKLIINNLYEKFYVSDQRLRFSISEKKSLIKGLTQDEVDKFFNEMIENITNFMIIDEVEALSRHLSLMFAGLYFRLIYVSDYQDLGLHLTNFKKEDLVSGYLRVAIQMQIQIQTLNKQKLATQASNIPIQVDNVASSDNNNNNTSTVKPPAPSSVVPVSMFAAKKSESNNENVLLKQTATHIIIETRIPRENIVLANTILQHNQRALNAPITGNEFRLILNGCNDSDPGQKILALKMAARTCSLSANQCLTVDNFLVDIEADLKTYEEEGDSIYYKAKGGRTHAKAVGECLILIQSLPRNYKSILDNLCRLCESLKSDNSPKLGPNLERNLVGLFNWIKDDKFNLEKKLEQENTKEKIVELQSKDKEKDQASEKSERSRRKRH